MLGSASRGADTQVAEYRLTLRAFQLDVLLAAHRHVNLESVVEELFFK